MNCVLQALWHLSALTHQPKITWVPQNKDTIINEITPPLWFTNNGYILPTVERLNSMPLCLTYKAMLPPTTKPARRYQPPWTQCLSHLLYCQNTLFRISFSTILASGKHTPSQIRWLPPLNLSIIITVFQNPSSHPPHPITAMASMITSNKLCPIADGIKLKCVDKNFYVVTFALFVVVCLSVVTIGGVKLRRRMMMR